MGFGRIGFIGLGAMGLPMARNLLKSGFELHVAAHRNRKPVMELKDEGAVEHASLSGVAGNCDILISILPEDRQMQEVLLSSQVLDVLKSDCVLIEMTSGSPGMMRKIDEAYRQRGIRVLDAPVSGGTAGAANGTLTVMAGGKPEVLETVRPVLEAMAGHIYRVGDVGAGKAMKAINQMLAGIHMIASAEAVALGEKLGIDKETMKKVIGNSSGASWMIVNKMETLSSRAYQPGFKLKLMKKDVQIALSEGAELALPLTSLALQLYKMAEKECGELDFSSVGKWILS